MSDRVTAAVLLLLLLLLGVVVGIIFHWAHENCKLIRRTYLSDADAATHQPADLQNQLRSVSNSNPRTHPTSSEAKTERSQIQSAAPLENNHREQPSTATEKQSRLSINFGLNRTALETQSRPILSTPPNQARSASQTPITEDFNFQQHVHDSYEQNRGTPGFIYIARNDEHRNHLFKLGHTAKSPNEREATLNRQLQESQDIGEFRIIHFAAVSKSLDAEEDLFFALAQRRVTNGREYFYGNEEALCRAVNAIAQKYQGSESALKEFSDSCPWSDSPEMLRPQMSNCDIPDRLTTDDGWVLVLRNAWHRPETYRLAYTIRPPNQFVHRLNSAQRSNTTQLGFYSIVACRAVRQPREAARTLRNHFEEYKIGRRFAFFRVQLNLINRLLSSLEVETVEPTHSRHENFAKIRVDIVHGAAHKSWAAWTSRCEHCSELLRFRGAVGAFGAVACPACGCLFKCKMGSAKAIVSPYT